MLASRSDWADLSLKIMGPGAKTFRHVEAGGYTYRSVTVCWNIGGLATFSVAAHEGMHQFLHRNLRNRLPAWADEGLATVAEGFVLRGQTVPIHPHTKRTSTHRPAKGHPRRKTPHAARTAKHPKRPSRLREANLGAGILRTTLGADELPATGRNVPCGHGTNAHRRLRRTTGQLESTRRKAFRLGPRAVHAPTSRPTWTPSTSNINNTARKLAGL